MAHRRGSRTSRATACLADRQLHRRRIALWVLVRKPVRLVASLLVLVLLALGLAACGEDGGNGAPIAEADLYVTSSDTVLDVEPPGVLGNDRDPDGDDLTAALDGCGAVYGTVSLLPNGAFRYTPGPAYVGQDVFRYRTSDGRAHSPSTAVTIMVGDATGDGPAIGSDPASTVTAQPGYVDVGDGAQATVAVQADGAWTAVASRPWMTIDPPRGEGDTDVTIRVSRDGMAPGTYGGSVQFCGAEPEATVEVVLRFPTLSGQLSHTDGTVRASSMTPHRSAGPEPAGRVAPHVEGRVVVRMNRPMAAWLQPGSAGDITALGEALSFHALRGAALEVAADHGARSVRPIARESDLFVMEVASVEEALASLRDDGRIASAARDYVYETQAAPNDPRYPEQWHYQAIELDAARDLTTGAERTVVAVIDGAVDVTHADLAGKLMGGFDFVTETETILTPASEHGTHVAGTVAAATNNGIGVAGVGGDVEVMPLNVFPDGVTTTSSLVASALYYASGSCPYLDDGTSVCGPGPVDVINLSLAPSNPDCEPVLRDETLEDALVHAFARDVALVAAAGNDACTLLSWPARSATTIGITAVGPSLALTDYSNYGPYMYMAAPGGDMSAGTAGGVLSTMPGGGYGHLAGTSMASPHVAGVAALMRSVNPNLSADEIYDVLGLTAIDLGPNGPDRYYGMGLVNADAAVREARSRLEAPTVAFVARLSGPQAREASLEGDGTFAFDNLAAGTYRLEVGNDVDTNGVLGEPGEFYASRTVTIEHGAGDVYVTVTAEAR